MSVRIGIVGTGSIGAVHMASLAKVPEASVVACTDVDFDKAAKRASGIPGCSPYKDVRAMLDQENLDAAYICVPPFAHGDLELMLIARGTPFFLEKPIGVNRETPQGVLAALENTRLITSVGYMMRYRENVQRVRDFLAKEQPVVARGAWIHGPENTLSVPWLIRKDQSGGQLNDATTHLIDLARYFFGEVRSVYCTGRNDLITGVENCTIEDTSICTLSFESGMICEMTTSIAAEAEELSLQIFTRKSRARLHELEMNLTLCDGADIQEHESTDDVRLVEDRVFVEAVLTGNPGQIKSTYADAFRTHRAVCAALESMESGQPVAL